jgi:predicted P-loop ATPase
MLILHQQKQDSGKSGFFRWLSPYPAWVKENGLEDNKDGYIALGRYLFVLDDELGGLTRVTQHERIKAMISTSKVDVRPPYARVDVKLDRTASFCGSTNNTDVFPSAEGTTRFLLLPLKEDVFKWEEYTKQVDRTKLWAEVKALVATDWLKINTPAIIEYRTATNIGYARDDQESYVVERFIRASEVDDGKVLRAGDIMREMCDTEYGYANLNIVRLGQALRKIFGERVFGHSPDGKECRGYKVTIIPANPAPTVSKKDVSVAEIKNKSFKAKRKKLSQR